jgi:hypothetical protein
MRIYYNECPKLREILLEKQSLQPGERWAIYENLKILIDNELISFDWVNQTGLARVVWVNQNNISWAFLSLVKKGFLVENWKQGNEKHFAPKDMDFLAFYLMRYL